MSLTPAIPDTHPTARPVLWLKALIGPAGTPKSFLDCLTQARIGRTWTSKTLAPVLEDLRRARLLDDKLNCPPHVAQQVAVATLATPEGRALAAAVRARLPAESKNYWDLRQVEIDVSRSLRLSVLLNDEAEFARVLPLSKGPVAALPDQFTRYFATVPLGVDWLASRTPALQQALMIVKNSHWVATGLMAPDHADLMAHCRQDPALLAACFPMLADFTLLSGRLADLEQLIAAAPADVPANAPMAFAAAAAFLAGDTGKAVALFTQALALYRKATRTRKGGLPGYMGLLHVCALLAAGDAAQYPAIEALLQIKGQAAWQASLGQIAVEALFDLARNNTDTAQAGLRWGLGAADKMNPPSPFSLGLLAIATAVVDPAQIKPRMEVWAAQFRRLATAMPLAADLLAEALDKAVKQKAGDAGPYRAHLTRPDREVRQRFTALLPMKEPWERALESLEAMLEPPATAQKATGGKRLAWLVDAESGEITPVEQVQQRAPTKSPTQGWSGGKTVALKRLYQGDARLTYLDDLDQRVIKTIKQHYNGGWGSGHSGYDYTVPPRAALPLLVGHPRVFDPHHPDQPVELVEGRAELVLAGCADGFRLALSHPAAEPDVVIEVETPGRWRVVVIDEKAVAAAKVLGLHGIVVPPAARDRLTALARLRMPDLPVRIDTSDLDDGLTEEGDPAPVVRLSPLGQGLKVSLVVRPLGADGPHFLPGAGARGVTGVAGARAATWRKRNDGPRPWSMPVPAWEATAATTTTAAWTGSNGSWTAWAPAWNS